MNNTSLKLMCVLAHPDDESLATGGILAKYAASGVQTYLVMATRGERGWFGPANENPGHQALGRLREAELEAAARELGIREVVYLDYLDGDLDQVNHAKAIGKIVTQLRRIKPDVVVTFDPNGMYGHPDHIAISQLTTTAVMAAADPNYQSMSTGWPSLQSPHRVAKLYYRAFLEAEQEDYEQTFGRLVMPVDNVDRRFTAWPEWAVTTRIDISAYRKQVWSAIMCHRTQLPDLHKPNTLSAPATLSGSPIAGETKPGGGAGESVTDKNYTRLATTQTYYRAMSMVNGGREVENDLFDGLRQRTQPQRFFFAPQAQPVAI